MKMKILHKIIIITLFTCYVIPLFSQIYTPKFKVYLDDKVNETSGLLLHNGKLWTHNDSGGKPVLYQIDTSTGIVLKEKFIKNVINRDWESICKDDKYAYIGDIGNNSGKLENFYIYRILLDDLDSENIDTLEADTITFYYNPGYYKKAEKAHNTNFDSEAIIAKGDSIYIFSKNWEDKKCYFYSIPKTPGKYMANLRDTLDVNGLVCGADYNPDVNTVALIGYVYGIPAPSLLILLTDFIDDNFFCGTVIRKELELKGYQTEGIAFVDNSTLFISNENFLGHKQALYKIRTGIYSSEDFLTTFQVYPSFAYDNVTFLVPVSGKYKFKIINSNNEIVSKCKRKFDENEINILDITEFDDGDYMMKIYNSKIDFFTRFSKIQF
jgi:hypothetical protein